MGFQRTALDVLLLTNRISYATKMASQFPGIPLRPTAAAALPRLIILALSGTIHIKAAEVLKSFASDVWAWMHKAASGNEWAHESVSFSA
jgi:hypothetical protein